MLTSSAHKRKNNRCKRWRSKKFGRKRRIHIKVKLLSMSQNESINKHNQTELEPMLATKTAITIIPNKTLFQIFNDLNEVWLVNKFLFTFIILALLLLLLYLKHRFLLFFLIFVHFFFLLSYLFFYFNVGDKMTLLVQLVDWVILLKSNLPHFQSDAHIFLSFVFFFLLTFFLLF